MLFGLDVGRVAILRNLSNTKPCRVAEPSRTRQPVGTPVTTASHPLPEPANPAPVEAEGSKPKSKSPPITTHQIVSEAFAVILCHNYENLSRWEQAAHSGTEIEGVHQLRVTVRRMRSALPLFESAVPPSAERHWREEMRWLASELGMARDLDVFISEVLSGLHAKLPLKGADRFMRIAEQRRAHAYQEQVRGMLDSSRYRRFKEGFRDWIDFREWEKVAHGTKRAERLSENIIPYARKRLDKQERRVLAAGSHVNRDNPEEMHRLRIACKKLRYATEFFLPLFTGMDVFISHMKGLQDLLGTLNDVAVTQHLLDALLAGQKDRQLFVYAGGIIGWRMCDSHHMLLRFDGCWEEFAEAQHPWWKKSRSDGTVPSGTADRAGDSPSGAVQKPT